MTSIGDFAFDDCRFITSVTIPSSVTSIGGRGFSGCTSLTSVTIPSGVKNIESGAFYGCTGLTSVKIPESVTSIGDYAFEECSALTAATIPSGVTSIRGDTFRNCMSLTSVTIPVSVTSIGYNAFNGCTNLQKVVYAGNSVQWKKISIGEGNDPLMEASRTYQSAEPQPPEITTQPKNASATGSNTATFTVQATGSGLSYQWQYRTSASGTWHDCTSLTKGYNTATLTVAGVSNSVNRNGFQYRCVVTNAAGATVTSNIATLTVKLAAPTLTVKLNAKGQPVLTWTASSCAVKYEIWRATSESGTYTKLSTISSRELTNSSAKVGTTYYYKVRALATDGTPGVFSAVKSAKATLAAPTLTVKLNAKGQPYLTWTAVTGAAKYEIWRAASSGGTYTKLTTSTYTSLTNTSVTAGKTYYYKVRAVDANGNAGVFSTVKSAKASLAAPTLTVKLNAKGQPYLTWTAVTGAAKYEIWRATSSNGTYTKLSTTTGKSLTNSSAKVGTTYYYKVRAVDANGNTGVFSAVKSAKATLAAPTLTVKLNAKGQPYLTWTAVTGAAKYEIWRATSANGTYTKLTTSTYTSLTNTSVTAGKTYYYKIRALTSNGTVGVFSTVKSVTAK